MAKGNSVKQALRWMMLGKGITQIVNWLVTIFVIRILTPADYGLLAMAMVLIAAGQMLRDMGLQHALVQAKALDEKMVRQIFTVLMLLNLGIFSVLYFIAPLAASSFDEQALTDIIRILAFQFPMLALQSIPSAMLSRAMEFRTKALIGAACSVANSAVTLVLAYLDFGVWSLVIGNLSATFLRCILLASVQRMLFLPILDFTGFQRIFSFGGFVMASSLLHYIQNKSAHLIIGQGLGKEDLGIYSVSNRLASLPMQKISGILNQVGFAAFAKIQADMAVVKESYLKMQAILCFFAFPIFWGIASVTDVLVPILLGEKWLAATVPLQIIALAAPLKMIFNTTTPALQGIGNSKLVFKNLLISALTMPAAYLFGLNWGVNGVAAVWITFYPLVFFYMHYRSLAALGIPFSHFLRAIFRPVLISASMLLLVSTSNLVLLETAILPVVQLVLLIGIGTLFYVLTSYWLNNQTFRSSWKLVF